MRIEAELGPLSLGESVSVNGACLTVAQHFAGGFEADVSLETVERTTLGSLAPGDLVNLERSLALGDRLGGHLVSGHVDGVADVTALSDAGEAMRVTLRAPPGLLPFIAEKGSVTLEGVSLTVNRVAGAEFEVMLIPHTREVTNLREMPIGRKLNLEVDLLARYVVRYLEATQGRTESTASLADALTRAGFT
jgi:riboflavin synthase